MPVFVEDPWSRIVKVHWKDDGPGGGEFYWPCGAFRHGYALGTTFGTNPGNAIFILDDFNIYAIAFDDNPHHSPTKPYTYWWTTSDYLPRGEAVNARDVPYIWGPGVNWTVTVDMVTLLARQPHLTGVRIQEYRNLNIQAVNSGPLVPDRIVDGPVIEVAHQTTAEIFPPGFRVQMTLSSFAPTTWLAVSYPPTLVQAHCAHETIGDYPPSPPGVSPGNYWYTYPAPGSTSWPMKPPPPPPYTE